MTPAPNPPPRGGAEPRVSADDLRVVCLARAADSDEHARLALDLRDARAKLEAAEAERDEARSDEALERMSILEHAARADAAEAALREMTEQRDGAWKAGRDAAASKADWWGARLENKMLRLTAASIADAIRRLAPPAETAAKEERT